MARYRDLTYRKELCDRRYVLNMAQRLVGQRVIIQMTDDSGWRSAWLLKVYPKNDRFKVKWTKDSSPVTIRGIWRIHNTVLFTNGQKPRPRGLHGLVAHATIQSTVNQKPRRAKMATKTKTKAKPGRPKSNGGIASMSETQKKALAKRVQSLRKNKVKWDGPDGICEQTGISSALVGRDLIREYGDDSLIRERSAGGSKPKAKSKAKASPAKAKAKRKVTVKRGRGKAANPS